MKKQLINLFIIISLSVCTNAFAQTDIMNSSNHVEDSTVNCSVNYGDDKFKDFKFLIKCDALTLRAEELQADLEKVEADYILLLNKDSKLAEGTLGSLENLRSKQKVLEAKRFCACVNKDQSLNLEKPLPPSSNQDVATEGLQVSIIDFYAEMTNLSAYIAPKRHLGDLAGGHKSEVESCSLENLDQLMKSKECSNADSKKRISNFISGIEKKLLKGDLGISSRVGTGRNSFRKLGKRLSTHFSSAGKNSCMSPRQYMDQRSTSGMSHGGFDLLNYANTHDDLIRLLSQDKSEAIVRKVPFGDDKVIIAKEHRAQIRDMFTFNPYFRKALDDKSYFAKLKAEFNRLTSMGLDPYTMFQDKKVLKSTYESLLNKCNKIFKVTKLFLCSPEDIKLHPSTLRNLNNEIIFAKKGVYPEVDIDDSKHGSNIRAFRGSCLSCKVGKPKSCDYSNRDNVFNNYFEDIMPSNKHKNSLAEVLRSDKKGRKNPDVFNRPDSYKFQKFSDEVCQVTDVFVPKNINSITRKYLDKVLSGKSAAEKKRILAILLGGENGVETAMSEKLSLTLDVEGNGIKLEMLGTYKEFCTVDCIGSDDFYSNPSEKCIEKSSDNKCLKTVKIDCKAAPAPNCGPAFHLMKSGMSRNEVDALYGLLEMQTNREWTRYEDLVSRIEMHKGDRKGVFVNSDGSKMTLSQKILHLRDLKNQYGFEDGAVVTGSDQEKELYAYYTSQNSKMHANTMDGYESLKTITVEELFSGEKTFTDLMDENKKVYENEGSKVADVPSSVTDRNSVNTQDDYLKLFFPKNGSDSPSTLGVVDLVKNKGIIKSAIEAVASTNINERVPKSSRNIASVDTVDNNSSSENNDIISHSISSDTEIENRKTSATVSSAGKISRNDEINKLQSELNEMKNKSKMDDLKSQVDRLKNEIENTDNSNDVVAGASNVAPAVRSQLSVNKGPLASARGISNTELSQSSLSDQSPSIHTTPINGSVNRSGISSDQETRGLASVGGAPTISANKGAEYVSDSNKLMEELKSQLGEEELAKSEKSDSEFEKVVLSEFVEMIDSAGNLKIGSEEDERRAVFLTMKAVGANGKSIKVLDADPRNSEYIVKKYAIKPYNLELKKCYDKEANDYKSSCWPKVSKKYFGDNFGSSLEARKNVERVDVHKSSDFKKTGLSISEILQVHKEEFEVYSEKAYH